MSKLEDFFHAAGSRSKANRLLLKWLSDDDERAALFAALRSWKQPLVFQSRADTKARTWLDEDSVFHQDVYLLTKRCDVEDALEGSKKGFSNAPYRALGSGTFMLGLDDGAEHDNQVKFASTYLKIKDLDKIVNALASVAFKAGAVLPLKQRRFDLVELSEEAAARFVGFLFGFAQGDHVLLEEATRQAYRGLNFQILGRHFVSDPGAVDGASRAMGLLLARVAHLIDLYQMSVGRDEVDELKRLDDELAELRAFTDRRGDAPLEDFVPLLRRIARHSEDGLNWDYSGAELAVIVVGLIAGTIGNIQASVSIAINEFFRRPDVFDQVKEIARESYAKDPDYGDSDELRAFVGEALRLNPPAAFLPRMTTRKVQLRGGGEIEGERTVILGVGGATREDGHDGFTGKLPVAWDPLIFGGKTGLHRCVGQYLVAPVITHFVRQVVALEGLAQCLDPQTAEPLGLEKLWGFNCRSYPLEYTRNDLLIQSPLIVVMRVKTPVAEHAEALKKIIKFGAPRIEKKLNDSGHVHFASFAFFENDAQLALYTVYDGDFDAYIEYFARDVGPLFDRIFEHIEDPPPHPVDKFPKEFVDKIRAYNRRPAADYFYSAYPKATVSMITQDHPPGGKK